LEEQPMSEPLDHQPPNGEPTAGEPSARGQDNPTQFSLRGLLWFMLVASAYFSQFPAMAQMATVRRDPWDDPAGWRFMATAVVTWTLLAIFYRNRRVRGMMVAHCAGPVAVLSYLFIALLVLLVALIRQDLPEIPGVGQLLFPIAIGCFVSSLVGFPCSVVQMVGRAFRDRRR
jgi:hypothetical protein